MMQNRVAHLIWANIVVDAFGTAMFLAGIGFFAISGEGVDATRLLSALATGGLVGVALSFPAASWVDLWGARRILAAVQVLQVATYLTMAMVGVHAVVLACCGIGAALSRVTSPVRGALPPLYLEKHALVPFKARVRVWTIAMSLAGSAAAAIVVLVFGDGHTELIPLVNAASFLFTLLLTLALPRALIAPSTKRRWWQLYRPPRSIVLTAGLFGLLLCLAYVPDAAVAVVVADLGLPPWIVAASPALALAVALGGERAVRSRAHVVARHARPILLAALAVQVSGLLALALAVHGPGSGDVVVSGLLVLSASAAEVALIGIMFVLWDVQYGVGDDENRGGIVGVFGIGTSAGMAASPATASALFFQDLGTALVVGALMIVVAVAGVLAFARSAADNSDAEATAAVTGR
ncbi:hypothetical protein L2K70_11120 [Nocardioides KLBMP 9356]|uniref:MFS transporter n=1 Tax=Nocardioides potassii TaxID=2911371 RepID=A0ABS9HDF8_9ACTN|nr:hypothetical protein [Nocardioides potassii]MCF6378153.1 hypothetical protein [Nocardioides potassii]